jgi:hypothetical protein
VVQIDLASFLLILVAFPALAVFLLVAVAASALYYTTAAVLTPCDAGNHADCHDGYAESGLVCECIPDGCESVGRYVQTLTSCDCWGTYCEVSP